MRAALEQVKEELGADALVLETKQIRSRGFFGIGARPLVELKVAVNDRAARRNTVSSATPSDSLEEINGDASYEASGAAANSVPGRTIGNAFSAVAARAYANESKATKDRWKSAASTPAPRDDKAVNPNNNHRPSRPAVRPRSTNRNNRNQAAASPADEKQRVSLSRKLDANGKAVASLQAAIGDYNKIQDEMRTQMKSMSFSMNAMVARQTVFDEETGMPPAFMNGQQVLDPRAKEIAAVLVSAGLRSAFAAEVVRAGLANTGPRVRSYETIARSGLVDTLPSFVRFSADPLVAAAATPSAIALIGPTGVGKTTTLAKLAARAVCHLRRRAVLITLDTYRIAATQQLRIYAEIIGADFHVANSVAELDELVQRLGAEALVLIDTAGRSPAEIGDEAELGNYLGGSKDILKMLVLPATTHQLDAQTAIRQFAFFRPDKLVLTKLDETSRPGAAASLAADADLPLAYLCAGQRVPEDLERATPLTFAARLVRSSFGFHTEIPANQPGTK